MATRPPPPEAIAHVDEKLQAVMDLVEKRAAGKATNNEVDAAVARVLAKESPKKTKARPNQQPIVARPDQEPIVARPDQEPIFARQHQQPVLVRQHQQPIAARQHQQPIVIPDTESYDEDDDDEEEEGEESKRTATPNTSNGKRGRKTQTNIVTLDPSLYEHIPLGSQGAQMLATFGDGRQPDPAAVAAVLVGARLMLHVAIQDARHIRRRHQAWFQHAQQHVSGVAPAAQESTEFMFRAATGRDPLSYSHKSGFAAEDLRTLFPEEMNAFTRFNTMRSEAEEADASKINEEAQGLPSPSTSPKKSVLASVTKNSNAEGHLVDRAANFDVRTKNMHEEWYFKYTELRRGSFLPRRSRKADQPKGGLAEAWNGFSMQQVRFLHWVGFDPQSPLHPPNDETTDALAFLAYDFVGRIVEKAIFFHLLEKNKVDTTCLLLELKEGDQLTEVDVQKAMDDLSPAPIYASSSRTQLPGSHPLFFGHGFENRLELEIEELLLEKELTPEELAVRKEEEDLFSQISATPQDILDPPKKKRRGK